MSERNVEWIIANAINEQARGDPDALAPHIIAALEKAGYRITPATEDTALGSQRFDELKPEMRPQDTYGDGRDWKFETTEHGGDEPDNMPQTIRATDLAGRRSNGKKTRAPATITSAGEIPDSHRWVSSLKIRFAIDSPLEGDGFELSVPRERGHRFELSLLFMSLKPSAF